jgi:hypothetical protein
MSHLAVAGLVVAMDTGVLHDLEIGENEEVFAKIDIVSSLRRHGAYLAVDYERHILNEYFRVLPSDSLGRRFITSCIRRSVLQYASGRLPRRQLEILRRDQFDPDDLPFIGVARATGGVFVTSEEKHLKQDRRDLVLTVCGVRVLSLLELSSFSP